MVRNRATIYSRFLAYFIDGLVLTFATSFISQIVYLAIGIDIEALTYTEEALLTSWMEYLYASLEGTTYDLNILINNLKAFLELWYVIFIIQSIVLLVVVILYLIVLPLVWEKQTIGRMLAKVKVVNKNDDNLSVKNLIFREILCTWLLYRVYAGTAIFIVTWILSSVEGRSLADYIGKTDLISTETKTVIVETFVVNNDNNDNNVNDNDDFQFKKPNVNDDNIIDNSDDDNDYTVV